MFKLSPSPEWRKANSAIEKQADNGRFANGTVNHAMSRQYETKAAALAAAKFAGLYPSAEICEDGVTTIIVASSYH